MFNDNLKQVYVSVAQYWKTYLLVYLFTPSKDCCDGERPLLSASATVGAFRNSPGDSSFFERKHSIYMMLFLKRKEKHFLLNWTIESEGLFTTSTVCTCNGAKNIGVSVSNLH